MQTINISEFRANLLKCLEVANSGKKISVTSNGKLMATIIPPENQKKQARKQLEALAINAKIFNVTSPIDTDWDVLS